jgi:hypothetical protein
MFAGGSAADANRTQVPAGASAPPSQEEEQGRAIYQALKDYGIEKGHIGK